MRKLKFNVDQLVKERRQYFAHIFPHEADVQLIKLTYDEAMTFDEPILDYGETPVDLYGQDRVLKEGEFYDGYALWTYKFCYWHFTVVKMRGAISRIQASEADKGIYGYTADEIRAGKAWQIVCPPENGKKRDWYFVNVLIFTNCYFAEMVDKIKDCSDELQDVDSYKLDESLRGKLVAALLTDEKVVTLTREEDMVLHAKLGRAYKAIFERLA